MLRFRFTTDRNVHPTFSFLRRTGMSMLRFRFTTDRNVHPTAFACRYLGAIVARRDRL
jgi:hypothetical protein